MPTLTKGSFSLNLGIVQLGGDLSDDDGQFMASLAKRVRGLSGAEALQWLRS